MAKRRATLDDATREGLSFNPMARTEAAQQEGEKAPSSYSDKAPKRQGDTAPSGQDDAAPIKLSVYLPPDLVDELERRYIQERANRRRNGDPQRVSRSSIIAAALRAYLGDPE